MPKPLNERQEQKSFAAFFRKEGLADVATVGGNAGWYKAVLTAAGCVVCCGPRPELIMAIPPQAAASPAVNPNANLSMSAAGLAALRASEGRRNGGGTYNDSANNCTRGTGILVHTGACSATEIAQAPDVADNEATFQNRVHSAEASVRSQVTNRALTQDQFDALVSASFNLGATGAAPIAERANRNDDAGVQAALRQRVFTHRHDANGRAFGPPQRNRGLAERREREARPFNPAGPRQ